MNERKPAGFSRYEEKAEAYVANLEKAADLVERASDKARAHAGALKKLWNDLQDLIRLLRAWSNRSYTQVPWKTILLAIAALLYFLDPIDIIPDFIPFIGYIDDATVLAFVLRSIRGDLDRFREWEADTTR